jgi:oxygen-independent coproporphyrinogen-3 oxidase
MYGLPKQTVLTFSNTLKKIIELEPDRVSVFGYGHVPWIKKHQQLIKDKPLNNESRLIFSQLAYDYLKNNGYKVIGIDHYAKKTSLIIHNLKEKKLQRNFQGYTEDNASVLIGVGASSISNLPNGYVQNTTKIVNYINALKNNRLPISRGYKMKADDKIYREIINELMCYLNVDLNRIAKKFGKNVNLFSSNIEKLKPFIDSEYVVFKDFKLFIKSEARPLVRIICSIFDQYFEPKTNRHSFGI